MKKNYTIAFILLCFSTLKAQLNYSYDCSFESDCSYFLNIDTSSQNIWQIGRPNKAFFGTAYDGNNAIVTDTLNTYPVNNHSFFELRFPISGTDTRLSFYHKFQMDTLNDGGYIEISIDSGLTWVNIANQGWGTDTLFGFWWQNWEVINPNTHSPLAVDTLSNGEVGFTGNSNYWIFTEINWVWMIIINQQEGFFRPPAAWVRFNFVSDSIQNSPKDGWLIDKILLEDYTLGSVENSSKNAISISTFPNPATTQITVETPIENLSDGKIVLYDLMGRELLSVPILEKQTTFSVEDLPEGMCFLTVYEKGIAIKTEKMLITRE